MRINDNFEKLPESYLFSEVAARLRSFREKNPGADVIRMDIGDVTLPVGNAVTEAMRRAVDDMNSRESFHGYGPEQGYRFLREAIAAHDYTDRGIKVTADEIFISDGAKSDIGNLGDIYSRGSVVAVADPGYPVYVEANVMDGRGGELLPDGRMSGFLYLECDAADGFRPQVPAAHADVIFLCSPSNPTGAVLTRADLEAWVGYALREKALIVFDSAYESFVTDASLPRSIYEIEGARECAIEVRSFSKTAGFTGLRCGYTVIPDTLAGYDSDGNAVPLRRLWLRRQTTKFNGASYVIQKGAAAVYTDAGQEEVRNHVGYYLENARIIRDAMRDAGFEVYGGENSPYVWVRSRKEADSWRLFDMMLEKYGVSCTPGSGFGRNGAGYIRLTGFNSRENTLRAMSRIGAASPLAKQI